MTQIKLNGFELVIDETAEIKTINGVEVLEKIDELISSANENYDNEIYRFDNTDSEYNCIMVGQDRKYAGDWDVEIDLIQNPID